MEVFRFHAPPVAFWSEELRIYEQCGSPHQITLDCATESRAPSNFFVRVHLDTSFSPIEFLAPAKKVIDLPEGCGWVRVSLRSASSGQMVLCKVQLGSH